MTTRPAAHPDRQQRHRTSTVHDHGTSPVQEEGETMGSVKVAIVGVGNCASSLVQGVEYYRDADATDVRPGPDARAVRRLPRLATSSSSPRSTSTPRRSASTCPRPSSPARTTPSRSPTCRRPASPCSAATPSTASASTTARPIEESDERAGRRGRRAARGRRRRRGLLPAGRLRARRRVLRPVRDRRRRRVRQRAAGVHRRHQGVGGQVHRRRRADRRRRHQVPGRRDHHAPRAGQAVRGPRRACWTAPCSSTSAATWTS